MAIDRVLRNLSGKNNQIIQKGTLILDGDLPDENRAILRECKAIAPISAPPLAAVPGWKTRAGKLEEYGIITADQYIEADNKLLRKVFKAPNARVDKWREELIQMLIIPQAKG